MEDIKRRKIQAISVNLNQMCNLNCVYCYRHVKSAQVAEMSDETIDQTIKFIRDNKIDQISFPQREPTMSFPKLRRMVETLGDGHRYHITTNGYALTKEMIEFFKQHKFGILISYDSLMQGFRHTVDGSDSSPFVRQSCRMLLEAGMNPTCLMLVTEQSLPLLERMVEDVIKLGFKNVFLNRDSQVKSPTCVRSVKLFEEKMRAVKKIGEEKGISLGPFHKIQQRMKGKRMKNSPCDFTCGAGKGGGAVHPDGVMYPCHHTNAWAELGKSIGSVSTGIDWEKKKWFEQAGPCATQMEKCRDCSSILCGMCYLDNYENTGDMLTPAKIGCDTLMALHRACETVPEPQMVRVITIRKGEMVRIEVQG
jgi:uncharacterized protein